MVKVVRADRLMHGKTSPVIHDGKTIFAGLEIPSRRCAIIRCWSSPLSIPDCLEVSARTAEGEIMGLRHRQHRIEGVQFHPESIGTPQGKDLLRNFLARAGA